jgi:hypothetical protein
MFLQAGSGIDAGFVSRATTLNCSFLIPHSTCGTAALIDSPGRFLRKNRGTAGWPCPQFPCPSTTAVRTGAEETSQPKTRSCRWSRRTVNLLIRSRCSQTHCISH